MSETSPTNATDHCNLFLEPSVDSSKLLANTVITHGGSAQPMEKGLCGTTVGPYMLVDLLGQGSMGQVYKAVHQKSGETLAVKLLQPAVNAGPQGLPLFLREASILLNLRHPRIVASREIGVHGSGPYIVMEYINTIDFRHLLRTASPGQRIRVACQFVAKVLGGLEYAHGQGVVHRDLKPANILVWREGPKINCKIADFGLAKRFADAGMSGLTEEGEARGTLAYMSPEQLQDSRSAGPSADLFAAGICLYEFVSDCSPYEGRSGFKLVQAILSGEVIPIRDVRPDVPPPLTEIVSRSLALCPADRFATAAEMRSALKAFLTRRS